jgi:hypothetical protein
MELPDKLVVGACGKKCQNGSPTSLQNSFEVHTLGALTAADAALSGESNSDHAEFDII